MCLALFYLKAGVLFFLKKKYKSEFFNKGDEKRKMKGKAAMLTLVILILAIVGPMQAAAYEHNWSWMAYTPEAHNWTALEPISPQHNWSAVEHEYEPHDWSAVVHEYKPHNWSNVLHKVEDEHDWSGVLHKHDQHDWSWMLPEPGENFNPNEGWWGH
jgi:hypothetical protein